jgi:purine-binding chemotaxis protein CheW
MHEPEQDLELESFGEPAWLADPPSEVDSGIEAPAWLETADTLAPGAVELPPGRQTVDSSSADAAPSFSLASEALADLATMENAVRRADGVPVVASAEPVAFDDDVPEEPSWTSEAIPDSATEHATQAPGQVAHQQADASLQSIIDEIDAQMAYSAGVSSPVDETPDDSTRVETATVQHVVFYLGTTRYSLPIEAVIEVSTVPRITALPGIPHYVRGVANLRGEILPVLDMRSLLGLPRISNTVLERMLVVRFTEQDAVVGLVVDRIRRLARLDQTRVIHPQGLADDAVLRFLEGVTEHENEVLNVLNARKIFLSEELRRLAGN